MLDLCMTPENDPGGVFHWPYLTDQFFEKEGHNIKSKFGRVLMMIFGLTKSLN
jgi:hypothetical protein